LVLPSEKVSRHHAIVREQDEHGFWVHDLGSANGTYVNGRRVTQPTRLKDGDRIGIADFQITFRQRSAKKTEDAPRNLEHTLVDFRRMVAWILVADIQGSTMLAQELTPEAMTAATGGWIARCRSTIEATGGSIEKLLGDGIMAVWQKGACTPKQVVEALKELKAFQAASQLPFRMVLHFGHVFTGGPMASGAEKLYGPEVNFSFRMEALAKQLAVNCLVSQTAFLQLTPLVTAEPAGSHSVAGFEGQFEFYSL
jgi:class 3 adenylate cyclase